MLERLARIRVLGLSQNQLLELRLMHLVGPRKRWREPSPRFALAA
jgi:hypothetical protein